MSRDWSQRRERGTVFALRLIHWIGVRIGRWAARFWLHPITLYFLLTAFPQRRASLAYLQRALGRKPSWRDCYRHIHCFAATILDRVYLLDDQFRRFDVRIHNGHLLRDQVRSGAGCLLLGSHLGSFEILRVLGLSESRFPLKVLMNIDHNQAITQFLEALNPEIAASVIPIGSPNTLLAVKEALEQGYLIGALGDRVVADDKAVRCQFMQQEASFPVGPLMLAGVMHCRVILFFGLYRGGNRYDIHFELLADDISLERGQRQQQLQQWLQNYAEILQRYTRSAPYNWFNFYDFWAKTK